MENMTALFNVLGYSPEELHDIILEKKIPVEVKEGEEYSTHLTTLDKSQVLV